MKIFIIIFVSFLLSGCKSMGTRTVEIEAGFDDNKQLEFCRAVYGSGSDIAKSFKGDMVLYATQESCSIILAGEGGANKTSEGHKATVESQKAIGQAIEKGIKTTGEGAVQGLKKSFIPGL